MATQTLYYAAPDGSLTERVTTAADPVPPEGATLLTAAEYAAKKEALEAAAAERDAAVVAAETAQRKDAYDALIAAGFGPAVAATLSGYTPSDEVTA
jgi:hypothetical protein